MDNSVSAKRTTQVVPQLNKTIFKENTTYATLHFSKINININTQTVT